MVGYQKVLQGLNGKCKCEHSITTHQINCKQAWKTHLQKYSVVMLNNNIKKNYPGDKNKYAITKN